MVCTVGNMSLSDKTGKTEDKGATGTTSRTRMPPGMSSGWRGHIITCETNH